MNNQSGNAFIYILVAIVLFAALSFTMTRMQDDGDTSEIATANLEFRVNEIMVYTSQVQKIIQQMVMSGTQINDIDFVEREDSGYSIPPHYNKIYHVSGGGLINKNMKDNMKNEVTIPKAGWYLDRFNNVEWTPTTNDDIILTAYQINEDICAGLNKKITGSEAIPALRVPPASALLDTRTNVDLDIDDCKECEGRTMLCVSDSSLTHWSFYAIIGAE